MPLRQDKKIFLFAVEVALRVAPAQRGFSPRGVVHCAVCCNAMDGVVGPHRVRGFAREKGLCQENQQAEASLWRACANSAWTQAWPSVKVLHWPQSLRAGNAVPPNPRRSEAAPTKAVIGLNLLDALAPAGRASDWASCWFNHLAVLSPCPSAAVWRTIRKFSITDLRANSSWPRRPNPAFRRAMNWASL